MNEWESNNPTNKSCIMMQLLDVQGIVIVKP